MSFLRGLTSIIHDLTGVSTSDNVHALSSGMGVQLRDYAFNGLRLGNVRFSVTGNVLTMTANSGSPGSDNPMIVATPHATILGAYQTRQITSALSITFPYSVNNQRCLGINTTDGQATYASGGVPNNGLASGIELFAYVGFDPDGVADFIGVSKSPLHTQLPSAYIHSSDATTFTIVGSADTQWDAMIVSGGAKATPANCKVVCVGPVMTCGITGGSAGAGRFQDLVLQSGYVPEWNNKKSKIRSSVHVDHGNGSGSTDINIFKFLTIDENVGDAIQYFSSGGTIASGGIGGAEFIATKSGYYSSRFFWRFGVIDHATFSLNSFGRNASIDTRPSAEQFAVSYGYFPFVAFSRQWLNAGDIWRPHAGGTIAAYDTTQEHVYASFEGFE